MTGPCVSCGSHHEPGERLNAQDHEPPAGDMERIEAATFSPHEPGRLEQIGAEWSAQVEAERADYSLAPCGGCPRFVPAAELCECDDEMGPFCPSCHREWHTGDRFLLGGAA